MKLEKTVINKAQCEDNIHRHCVAIYRSAKTVVDFSDQNINDGDRQEMHTVLLNVLATMNQAGWMHNDLKEENLVKFTHGDDTVEYLVTDFGTATHVKGECERKCDEEYFKNLEKDFLEGADEKNKLCLAKCLPSHETTTEESFDIQKPLKKRRIGGSSRKFIGAFIGLGITVSCAAIGAIFA